MPDVKIPILIIVLALAGLIAGCIGQVPVEAPAPEGLGSELLERAQNPIAGQLPEINPFREANPFAGTYQNPFGG